MNCLALKRPNIYRLICFLLLSATFCACNKEELYTNLPVYGPTQVFYALNDKNTLTVYNAEDVRNVGARVTIAGLAPQEHILSIDFRPATGELYGVSSLNKLYIIDVSSGKTQAVAATSFSPLLEGTAASIDFNPVNDRIRIVTNTGQNLRLNPETGTVEGVDAKLNSTTITGIAHNNNYAGASTAILYDLDAAAKKLYQQNPQNAGTLVGIGNLDVDLGDNVSFDISPDNSNILAVGKAGDSTKLYTIRLSDGKTTLAGKFASGTTIKAIAIPTHPVAYAVDNTNHLLIFNPLEKKPSIHSQPITGLQTGEVIYGMDMRPLNGQIYALGSSNRLYTVNTSTGELSLVGLLNTPLSGTSFGFDFNPLTDSIYVVSNTGQNLRIKPTTAAVTALANISPATAKISAAAFGNNFRTTTATSLYVIDDVTDKLYKQDVNTGVITEVGDLKIDVTASNGFDILYNSGDVALGVFTEGTQTGVYLVDTSTGQAILGFNLSKPVTAFTMGLRFN